MRKPKIWLLVLCLALSAALLSSCAFLPYLTFDSMNRGTERYSAPAATAVPAAGRTAGSDEVIISRKDYERYQKLDTLLDIMDLVDAYYYEDADEELMLEGAAAGMLDAVGDPYTFYYSPEDYQELWEDDAGSYVGIGVMISANYSTQICTITRVFKDGPAEKAGVRNGDILYRVGEDLYVNADNLTDAVNIMRGVPGTDVDVTFLRAGQELTFTITRAQVSVNRVDSLMLDGQIGYIRLYEFAGDCANEFASALSELEDSGARGLIIDLRDNGGGWVDDARMIGDKFMDKGILCYLKYKDGHREDYKTRDGKTDIPLVILVNQYSASASEILTGALKDRTEATVVGVHTYGKGVVQSVLPLGDKGEGMQVTVAQYFTPNGNAVHKIGIEPDVVAELPEGDPGDYDLGDTVNDIQLIRAIEVMQEKLGDAAEETPAGEPAGDAPESEETPSDTADESLLFEGDGMDQ